MKKWFKIKLHNHIEEISEAMKLLRKEFGSYEYPLTFSRRIFVVLDEILSNIIGYGKQSFHAEIEIYYRLNPSKVELCFVDGGIKYDPLKHFRKKPLISENSESIGGWGLYLVKKLTQKIKYVRLKDKNILYVRFSKHR